jgi:hypothetical protein
MIYRFFFDFANFKFQLVPLQHGKSGVGSRMFDDHMAGVLAGAGGAGGFVAGYRGGLAAAAGAGQLPPITHGVGGGGAIKFPAGTPTRAAAPTQGSGDDFRWSRVGV